MEQNHTAGRMVNPDAAWQVVFRDADWMFKTGIGGIILACMALSGLFMAQSSSLLLLPVFFALCALTVGYTLRVMRSVAGAQQDFALLPMPNWGDWADLFMSGITWISLQVFYIFMFITVGTGALLISAGLQQGAAIPGLPVASCLLALCLSWFILSLVMCYLMANFACEENFAAGLAIRKVLRQIAKRPFLFIGCHLLCVGIQFASIILPALTLVGVFALPTTFFIGQLVGNIVIAQLWKSFQGIVPNPPDSSSGSESDSNSNRFPAN